MGFPLQALSVHTAPSAVLSDQVLRDLLVNERSLLTEFQEGSWASKRDLARLWRTELLVSWRVEFGIQQGLCGQRALPLPAPPQPQCICFAKPSSHAHQLTARREQK